MGGIERDEVDRNSSSDYDKQEGIWKTLDGVTTPILILPMFPAILLSVLSTYDPFHGLSPEFDFESTW